MRLLRRSFFLLAALVLALSPAARADVITLSLSQYATGTIGSQSFTNQLVTFTGSFTTEQFATCQDISSSDYCVEGPGLFLVDSNAGLITTIGVSGIGTFDALGLDYFEFAYSGGDLADISIFSAGDSGELLSLPNPFLGADCYPNVPFSFDCPVAASTSAGDLILTSVGSFSTSVQITGDSSVPEPSTLTLFAGGALGLCEMARRRMKLSGFGPQ